MLIKKKSQTPYRIIKKVLATVTIVYILFVAESFLFTNRLCTGLNRFYIVGLITCIVEGKMRLP